MKKIAGRKDFIFQQNSATSHTANMVLQYLETAVLELLKPDHWPPSSPDLNSLDYGIWSILKKNVYRQKIRDVDHLKQRIRAVWQELSQDQIDNTINRFRMRVKKMPEVEGKRFEHLLKL